MKSSWLDNTVRVNTAIFSYTYDNLQSLVFVQGECLPNSNLGTYLFETSDVEGDGFELNVNRLALPSLNCISIPATSTRNTSARTSAR